MKKGDKIMALIFAVILAVGALSGIWRHYFAANGAEAEIVCDGRVVKVVNLSRAAGEEYRFVSAYCTNIVRAERGRIAVISADCPDKDCVRRGFISRAGERAVCLPGRLVIRIIGRAEIDGVTY